jgi:repressor LexA
MRQQNDKHQQVYQFIVEFTNENNYPPTVREICKQFGFSSTSVAYYYLEKLRKQGKISNDKNKNRAISLPNEAKRKANTCVAPLIGKVSAGMGILAVEDYEGEICLPKDIYNDDDLFVLRVDGDSMINAGISNGDFVVVKKQSTANVGEIVLALWQETATIKRLMSTNPFVLHPENDAMDDIVIEKEENPTILGKVVGCLKKF